MRTVGVTLIHCNRQAQRHGEDNFCFSIADLRMRLISKISRTYSIPTIFRISNCKQTKKKQSEFY